MKRLFSAQTDPSSMRVGKYRTGAGFTCLSEILEIFIIIIYYITIRKANRTGTHGQKAKARLQKAETETVETS